MSQIETSSSSSSSLLLDKTRFRPPGEAFQCGEYHNCDGEKKAEGIADADSSSSTSTARKRISFFCTAAGNDQDQQRLVFQCHEPSYGVLIEGEEPATSTTTTVSTTKSSSSSEDEGGNVDCFLFDEGFSLMGRTGFQVWPGSRIMIEALVYPRPTDCPSLKYWQNRLAETQSLKILELGAGVGCVGASLAEAGAEVLLTDLPRIVTDSLLPNLERNARTYQHDDNEQGSSCPPWLESTQPKRIGRGWVGAKPLDWTLPVNDQLRSEQYKDIDLVVACDCVWLISLLRTLFSAVHAIFEACRDNNKPPPKLLLSFQRRDSDMFTTFDRVMDELRKHNWAVECLAWYTVVYESPEHDDDGTKELMIFEISFTGSL